MSGIKFDKYLELAEEKRKRKKGIYKTLLKHIEDKINTLLSTQKFLFYEIPAISWEEDTYNFLEATEYVLSKIKKNKTFCKVLVDIKILEPNYLYLEWDLLKLNTKSSTDKKLDK
jgi:hypothetical protein